MMNVCCQHQPLHSSVMAHAQQACRAVRGCREKVIGLSDRQLRVPRKKGCRLKQTIIVERSDQQREKNPFKDYIFYFLCGIHSSGNLQ